MSGSLRTRILTSLATVAILAILLLNVLFDRYLIRQRRQLEDGRITILQAGEVLERTRMLLVGSSVVLVLIVGGTAFLVHFRFVKGSIRRINEGIAALERGRFKTRIETGRNDELGSLAERINRLGDRLEQMRQELESSHKAELERAEKMAQVGELAASIAHEIKNPIAGISSAMQVLIAELPQGDERAQIFEEILHQTSRINRAVNDLLSYARPTLPEFAVGSLNDPIRRALTLLEAQRREAHIELNVDLDSEPPPVLLDQQQMSQVFLNLFINAIQAMPDGGSLMIKSGLDEDFVFATVADTGSGIPKEIMLDIFKPFFTTKHQGTGLGLSICRSIVENHCGHLTAESDRGLGTTFKVTLPVHGRSIEAV
ncbi:MAG: HAMP domain-containing protein [Calditrichaeota bacterium]|nr:HAMP domain-containing protein [Calditrichota bacterium]